MAYRKLMLGYNQINAEKSMFYARKALYISRRQHWELANADAYKYIGQHFWAREKDILYLLSKGYTAPDIAGALGLI